jgi:DNA polymerase III alpha subunit
MWTNTNTQEQLVQGILRHGPDILEYCQTNDDIQKYLNRIVEERLNYPVPNTEIDTNNWFIPREYKDLDIAEYCINQCKTDEELERVALELQLFQDNNMITVLKAMKYVVDTLRANNVVWGVGRGSSVASYVLHIIGVHKINSIKYNIPIEEFFKGDQNG